MADIIHEFIVKVEPERVFQLFATPSRLEKWWTKTSSGECREGGGFWLYFGPEFDWQAKVTRYLPPSAFELQITQAHVDWVGNRVGCELSPEGKNATRVRFHHTGWSEQNEHWRVSCFCWAMYLRLLRRNLEYREFVEYEQRLDA
jgi:uncharacterized protein YndB with AHSA1/START domain